jgi:hypothetical protein
MYKHTDQLARVLLTGRADPLMRKFKHVSQHRKVENRLLLGVHRPQAKVEVQSKEGLRFRRKRRTDKKDLSKALLRGIVLKR